MAKDNRVILQGVQFHENGVMHTYADGMEDELEAVLTPVQCERLLAQGAIVGDWHPKGTEVPPLPAVVDPAEREKAVRKLEAQNAQLRRELAEAHRVAAEKASGPGAPVAAPGAGVGTSSGHPHPDPVPSEPEHEQVRPRRGKASEADK